MNAWQKYLGDAAGVPELQACGLRSIQPGILMPMNEIPYPTIARESQSSESSTPPLTGRKKVELMTRKMKAMEETLAGLRVATSSLFGSSFMVHYSNAKISPERFQKPRDNAESGMEEV